MTNPCTQTGPAMAGKVEEELSKVWSVAGVPLVLKAMRVAWFGACMAIVK